MRTYGIIGKFRVRTEMRTRACPKTNNLPMIPTSSKNNTKLEQSPSALCASGDTPSPSLLGLGGLPPEASQRRRVVGQEELESSTSAVSERHSNQLNY